ncbi:MAG TPA: hypothetical protein VHX61_09555 [Rhizomicrobium sp.]|jgi:hypothetical protein|nr:hypothetical protein [Rhizomicrobium sp.]
MISSTEWDGASQDEKLGLLRSELESVLEAIADLWRGISEKHAETLAAINALRGEMGDVEIEDGDLEEDELEDAHVGEGELAEFEGDDDDDDDDE